MQSLEGLWQPVYAEFEGAEAPKMMLDKMELDLTADRYAVRFGGQTADQGSYTTDAAGITLHGMIGPNAGRSIPSLYKFTGAMLTICYGLSGARPTKYATAPDTQLYLVNYTKKVASSG